MDCRIAIFAASSRGARPPSGAPPRALAGRLKKPACGYSNLSMSVAGRNRRHPRRARSPRPDATASLSKSPKAIGFWYKKGFRIVALYAISIAPEPHTWLQPRPDLPFHHRQRVQWPIPEFLARDADQVVVKSKVWKCGLDFFHLPAGESKSPKPLRGIDPIAFSEHLDEGMRRSRGFAKTVVQVDHLGDLRNP